ncbi:MAG: family 43 glycosylhydrolase [Prevotella sp.]|nr:family 43 glycosylhydrolase [Prevotella sp.]
MRTKTIIMILLTILSVTSKAQESSQFHPGKVWLDDEGNIINAHGGGLLYHDGTYYWYGEYKQGETVLPEWATWECYRTDVTGVSCYSSKDMYNWHFEGIVLGAEKVDSLHDLHTSKVVERPKVIYNAKTRKFVMWMHIDSADYTKACAGVAVSDSPTGPYTYLGSFRPNGEMSRDQTLFVDDDGKAYHICSSEDNATMYIHLLAEDYLKPTSTHTRNFVQKYREAPAVFKYKGKYYLLTSGCSGWDPNVADMAVADSMLGEWTSLGNPCVGKNADKTFYGQSTYVQPIVGHPDLWIAMFDKWRKTDLPDSRYIWLPLRFEGDTPKIVWHEAWTF